MLRYRLLVFILILLPMASQANNCMNNGKAHESMSDEEINICQYNRAKHLELKLRDLVALIQARLPKAQLARFNEAQGHWVGMTQKDCEIEADFFEGAPIYPAILAQCQQQHYRTRINHINRYLCPENNLVEACPEAREWAVE